LAFEKSPETLFGGFMDFSNLGATDKEIEDLKGSG
jgi:hypothetical protein